MTHPYLTGAIAHEHERELRSAVARARLVALAKCCRPSRVREAVSQLRARLQRDSAAVCCA